MKGEDDRLLFEVEEVLRLEKRVILEGSFSEMESLYDQKSRLIEKLRMSRTVDLSQLKKLRSQAINNQELMAQSMKGLKLISERLLEMRIVQENLQTYDEFGNRKKVKNMKNSFEKRA